MTNIDQEIIDTIELARARILELDPDPSAFSTESSSYYLARTYHGRASDRERCFDLEFTNSGVIATLFDPSIRPKYSLSVLTQRHIKLLVDWEMNGGKLDSLTREVAAANCSVHFKSESARMKEKSK